MFGGYQIQISSYDNKLIDCLFLEGRNEENQVIIPTFTRMDYNEEKDYAFTKHPTILFCNPNGAYYEILARENCWVSFYLERGINVMYYNYRGYGRSEGTSTPYIIKRDGISIVNYMRKRMKLKQIGVHGQSLGGMVASHLANEMSLELLVADRTFSSMANVVYYTFPTVLYYLYCMLTHWDTFNNQDYLDTNCLKICTMDSKD